MCARKISATDLCGLVPYYINEIIRVVQRSHLDDISLVPHSKALPSVASREDHAGRGRRRREAGRVARREAGEVTRAVSLEHIGSLLFKATSQFTCFSIQMGQ